MIRLEDVLAIAGETDRLDGRQLGQVNVDQLILAIADEDPTPIDMTSIEAHNDLTNDHYF